jgi:hypothetical protein
MNGVVARVAVEMMSACRAAAGRSLTTSPGNPKARKGAGSRTSGRRFHHSTCRIGRVAHLIYGSDVDTPESVAVVRHGLTGTQTEVIPIGRIDLINATTQIVQLRDE